MEHAAVDAEILYDGLVLPGEDIAEAGVEATEVYEEEHWGLVDAAFAAGGEEGVVEILVVHGDTSGRDCFVAAASPPLLAMTVYGECIVDV